MVGGVFLLGWLSMRFVHDAARQQLHVGPLVTMAADLVCQDPSLRGVRIDVTGSSPPVSADAGMLTIVTRAGELFGQRREWWLPGAAKTQSGEHEHVVIYRIQIDRLTGRRATRDRE